ncbi:type II toxin-antitoxin system RelE/ParE family toxin [Rhizobium sp.]|jgi:plasmid stabilization system protein ParE|uniref:type II toxin-antitoxin system RelE/ParE family toxin n=1 Tax=Rhizobium sp. TaxID=391 RepID=UPI000DDA8E67
MKKVRIAAPAMRFVRHEKAYLKRVSRHAAVQFAQQLKQMTRTLSEFPGAGARTLAPGDVRCFVSPPYLFEYEIHPDEVVILLIYHGRQERLLQIDEDGDLSDS